MTHYWSTVVCVASGQSLTDEDCEYARRAQEAGRCHIIVVNDNWQKIPSAHALYVADGSFLRLYYEDIRQKFLGEVWTCDRHWANLLGLNFIAINRTGRGLSIAPDIINSGRNSGYQAINLAHHFGAKRIILLGYDMQGQRWFGEHPAPLTNGDPSRWVYYFKQLAVDLDHAGVEVINCTRRTALSCFHQQRLEVTL